MSPKYSDIGDLEAFFFFAPPVPPLDECRSQRGELLFYLTSTPSWPDETRSLTLNQQVSRFGGTLWGHPVQERSQEPEGEAVDGGGLERSVCCWGSVGTLSSFSA